MKGQNKCQEPNRKPSQKGQNESYPKLKRQKVYFSQYKFISNYLYALGSKLVQTISIMTTFRLCFLCELHQQALTSCIPKLQETGEKNKVSHFKKTHIAYTTDGEGSFQAIQ